MLKCKLRFGFGRAFYTVFENRFKCFYGNILNCIVSEQKKTKRMSSSSSNNNSRSSSVQTSHESKCKLAFRITKKKDGGAVYFKQDGTRFATEQTLKLQARTEYAVKLEVSPALELE